MGLSVPRAKKEGRSALSFFASLPVSRRGDQIVSSPKFAIGQIVDFERNATSMSRARGPYEVTRVLPVDAANSPMYRIKSKVEPFERAASEHDLVPVSLPPPARAPAALWPVRRRT